MAATVQPGDNFRAFVGYELGHGVALSARSGKLWCFRNVRFTSYESRDRCDDSS